MKNARGFTLIELVIVVIILGLLAITAAPRLLKTAQDAETASAEGVAGGFASAVGLVRAQWEVEGRPAAGTDFEIDQDGTVIQVGTTGYPTGLSGNDETDFDVNDCIDVWNTIFQNPANVTSDTTPNDNDDYYVVRGGGDGENARCVYYQIASIRLEAGDVPDDADGNNDGTYGKGFNYYPVNGNVFRFSND